MIGRASGVVHRYFLPHLTPEGQHVLRCRPQVGQACPGWKAEGGVLTTAFAFTSKLAVSKSPGLPRLSSTPLPVAAAMPILACLPLPRVCSDAGPELQHEQDERHRHQRCAVVL